MLTIYDLNNRDSAGSARMMREVTGYEGFLSSARFIDDENIITGSGKCPDELSMNVIILSLEILSSLLSGDMKVMHLKTETGQKLLDLEGHNGDVAALSLNPTETNTFITGQ